MTNQHCNWGEGHERNLVRTVWIFCPCTVDAWGVMITIVRGAELNVPIEPSGPYAPNGPHGPTGPAIVPSPKHLGKPTRAPQAAERAPPPSTTTNTTNTPTSSITELLVIMQNRAIQAISKVPVYRTLYKMPAFTYKTLYKTLKSLRLTYKTLILNIKCS